jgi:hypothetical protein
VSTQGVLPTEAFSGRWRARVQERQRARVPFGPYALRIPEPDVGKLDMRRMPFQAEVYEETGDLPNLVINKGTQVGMSTAFVRWCCWVADELSGRVVYVMPTQDIADDFSDDRVKRLMEQDVLSDRIPEGGTQNKRLKRIGRGMIYFRGSIQETSLDNIPARGLVLDEYDTLSQANIPVVERRVGAQEDPLIRRLGVPTLQAYGIDKLFSGTDMRRWVVCCDHCGEWQRITWDNVREEEYAPGEYRGWRVCVHCEGELESLLRSGGGEWVAEHPDRPTRGYHIPRLIVPGADVGAMVKASHSDDEEALKNHYNRDRAEPFETPEQRLSREAIQSCRRPGLHYAESYVGFNPVTMGIDQASSRPLNVVIREHLSPTEKRVLALLEVPVTLAAPETAEGEADAAVDKSALRRLAELMQVYKVQMACIDHLPDGIFANAFCAAHPGRAYKVAFNTAPLARNSIVTPKPNQLTDLLVTVKRSEWITVTLNAFRHQRNLLPLEQPLPKDYEEHLRNAVKERKTDKHGREFYVYTETGDVDWLMAELYETVATEVLKLRMMEGAIVAGTAPTEVEPEHRTADFNDWDAKPWSGGVDDPLDVARGTYGPDWDDDYRP